MGNRAETRRCRSKAKRKARIIGLIRQNQADSYQNSWYLEQAIKRHDTLKDCSCHMCCNRRRDRWVNSAQRMTKAERLAQIEMHEQIMEQEKDLKMELDRIRRESVDADWDWSWEMEYDFGFGG